MIHKEVYTYNDQAQVQVIFTLPKSIWADKICLVGDYMLLFKKSKRVVKIIELHDLPARVHPHVSKLDARFGNRRSLAVAARKGIAGEVGVRLIFGD